MENITNFMKLENLRKLANTWKGKNKGNGPPGKDNHMIVEEAHQQDESGPAERKRPAEGKLEPMPNDNVVTSPEEAHHLDCFEYHHIQTQAALTRSGPQSRTPLSARPSSRSRKRHRVQPGSSSPGDTCEQPQPEHRAVEAYAVENIICDLFNEGLALEDQASGSSNNQLVHPKQDLTPTVVAVASNANGIHYKRTLRFLPDSGSTSNFIYLDKLPKACKPKTLETALDVSLLKGEATVNQYVDLEDVVLTDLSRSRHIKGLQFYIAPGQSNYDGIIGRRTMKKLGIDLCFETDTIHWKGQSAPMKPLMTANRKARFQTVQQQFLASLEDTDDELAPQGHEFEANYFTSVKLNESKCEKHEVDAVAEQQTHLNAAQKEELKVLLRKFTKLFSGKLGSYPHKKMSLDVDRQALKRLRHKGLILFHMSTVTCSIKSFNALWN